MSHSRRGPSQVDIDRHRPALLAILDAVARTPRLTPARLDRILKDHPLDGRSLFPRDAVVQAYRTWAGAEGLPPFDPAVLERLRLKPVRTASGVTPVTVLTKPFPCPGTCVFCPSDVRMPKSYLASEPGAQRAERHGFDPYRQTIARLTALRAIGHPVDKVELIILGGTWSFYPEPYQIWFVHRCFEALCDFGEGHVQRSAASGHESSAAEAPAAAFSPTWGAIARSGAVPRSDVARTDLSPVRPYNAVVQDLYADALRRAREAADAIAAGTRVRGHDDEYATWGELAAVHRRNEAAACRAVGLVVETRPDHVALDEVVRLRRLGVTKVQLGLQSLDDAVLAANRRGHAVLASRRAMRLLRRAGFKLHAHWMPNLLGATPESDRADYRRLFADPGFRPDELKIYPCALVESAELMAFHRDGAWRPYSQEALVDLLVECFLATPEYCRLTRVIRDIPSTDIVAGEMRTNLRQEVDRSLAERGLRSVDIRAREVRHRRVAIGELRLEETGYRTSAGDEVFLQFATPDAERRIAGFLRLTLPDGACSPPLDELAGAAIIREVHVYGQAVEIGTTGAGKAQHAGLGTRLIERAAEIAAWEGYRRLAVISAVGTRAYYRRRGFAEGDLYQLRSL